ncbi:hypothetical protein PMI38_05030 [Pseudomonas sp. GM84]|nr:hypothetical protein PMI38_05030 [Pseudomonas sp. GM84]
MRCLKAGTSLWERACPANTGEAGAIHRAAPFAGQARSHRKHRTSFPFTQKSTLADNRKTRGVPWVR